MSLGPVMIDLEGAVLTESERDMLLHPNTGGVILFARNYESIEQLEELVKDIHSLRSPHLLVAVDHEGGRVQRFHEGFTRLPSAACFGKIYNDDNNRACILAESTGWLMAVELRTIGIDLSFAPVLDLGKGVSGVIGDRAFHHQPETTATIALAYMRGMIKAGMQATGKHFPGHGTVKEDSHIACPKDSRQLEDIMMEDVLPFERLIHNGLAAIMPAHVIYSSVDELPAGYSSFWLKEILRNRLQFQGMIFSDDLSMEAACVVGDYRERTVAALAAGCDMVVVCNHPEGAARIIDADLKINPAAQMRAVRMHGKLDVTREELQSSQPWKETVAKIRELDQSPYMELDV